MKGKLNIWDWHCFNAIETRCFLDVKYEVVAGESDDTRNEQIAINKKVTTSDSLYGIHYGRVVER